MSLIARLSLDERKRVAAVGCRILDIIQPQDPTARAVSAIFGYETSFFTTGA